VQSTRGARAGGFFCAGRRCWRRNLADGILFRVQFNHFAIVTIRTGFSGRRGEVVRRRSSSRGPHRPDREPEHHATEVLKPWRAAGDFVRMRFRGCQVGRAFDKRASGTRTAWLAVASRQRPREEELAGSRSGRSCMRYMFPYTQVHLLLVGGEGGA